MLKRVLLLATHLLFCAALFAQTDNPGCNLYASRSDQGCTTGQEDCIFTSGCTSYSFSVVCAGTYWIKASVSCTGTSCTNCAACVNIYEVGGEGQLIASTTTLDNCGATCCAVSSRTLQAGNYIMYVCLRDCPGGNRIACCGANPPCVATGIVSSQQLNCP